MFRQDLQWWAGAIAAALIAGLALGTLPHPYDGYVAFSAAALGAFALYKVTPSGSTKD